MTEDSALKEFVSAQNVLERFKALLELSKDRKRIHEAAKSPNFVAGLESLFEVARSSGAPEDRLMAAAAVARVSSVIKSLRKKTEEIAKKYLIERLPPLEIMQNPDDRYYVAKACNMISADWVGDYLAEATIGEDTAEKARTEYIVGLFKSVRTLQAAFDMLTQKFNQWTPDTERAAETATRRLKRVLSAIRPALMEYEGEITPNAGRSLARMIRAAFRGASEVQEQQTLKELASEVAETIHNLIRSRFSLATDPTTYEAMRVVRGWFPQYRWEDFAKGSDSMRKVTLDLLEGMTLLARQGIMDDSMFECLTVVLGSEDSARQKTAELGRSPSSLTDDVRRWLITGQTTTRRPSESDLAVRSAEQRENLFLASLLVDMERLGLRAMLIQKEYFAKTNALDSSIVRQTENFLGQAQTVVDTFRSFCSKRGLRIREKINDIVEYSPSDHEIVTGIAQGIRKVRVIEPVVEKIDEAGVPSIVRRGLVEPFLER